MRRDEKYYSETETNIEGEIWNGRVGMRRDEKYFSETETQILRVRYGMGEWE